MSVFKNLTELSATIIESLIILEFLGKMSKYKYDGIKKYFCFLATLIISTAYITIVNSYIIFDGFLGLLSVTIFILYGFICLKGSSLKKMLLPLLLFSIIACINVSKTYLFSNLFTGNYVDFMSPESPVRLLSLFITKFTFFIATRILLYIFKKDDLDLKKTELLVICTLFILSTSVVIANLETQIGSNQTLFNLISSLCVIAINVFIFTMMKRMSKENKNKLQIALLEMQLSEQKALIADAGNLSKEIKKVEHDIKHHFISLLGILGDKNYDEADEYIQNLIGEYETSIFKYISIDNSAVNSVLNFKISRCHSHNIDIKIEIESDFELFDTLDICVLLSNILDNAIEASIEIDNPKISLIIREEKNYLCITVRNKIAQSVLEHNKNLKTTKKDSKNHGLGLYSISQIIDKYDGIQKFYEMKNYFIADIWLKKRLYSLSERIREEADYHTRQI
jgi:sensor histidine kinase YesM